MWTKTLVKCLDTYFNELSDFEASFNNRSLMMIATKACRFLI